MQYKDLTQIDKGKKVKVVEITGGNNFQKKIEAIGLRIGSQVEKLSAQMLNGPVTIKVGSTKLALGRGMAKKIFVDGQDA